MLSKIMDEIVIWTRVNLTHLFRSNQLRLKQNSSPSAKIRSQRKSDNSILHFDEQIPNTVAHTLNPLTPGPPLLRYETNRHSYSIYRIAHLISVQIR